MQIELKSIKIADLIDGYVNDPDTGVKGYHGKLDIRPPYQREFRYDEKQQQAVIDTILKGFPLNIMYWSVDDNGNFEMIDGQQRTLSICGFYTHDFNIVDHDRGTLYFSTLTAEEKEKFLNYELTVYFCEGTDKEKLDWFRVINIAGEKLLDQELLNAVYSGPFVTDARRHFSKNGCPAYKMGADFLNGNAIEQAYLSTILKWAARHDGVESIDKYMALHQFDPNANKLWAYFVSIITWIRSTFVKYRREMKGLDWGEMFDKYGDGVYDTAALEKQIHDLMEDDEIMKKSGIYRYVLSAVLLQVAVGGYGKGAFCNFKGYCVLCKGVVCGIAVQRYRHHVFAGIDSGSLCRRIAVVGEGIVEHLAQPEYRFGCRMQVFRGEVVLQFQLFPGPVVIVIGGCHLRRGRKLYPGILSVRYFVDKEVVVAIVQVQVFREPFTLEKELFAISQIGTLAHVGASDEGKREVTQRKEHFVIGVVSEVVRRFALRLHGRIA